MRRRPLLVSAFALALLAALLLVTPATGQDPGEQKARVDQRMTALQQEIQASKDQEGVLTSQLDQVASELRAAQAAVDEAQDGLDRLEAELAGEQERLAELTALLKVQTRRLVRLQAEYARAVEVLEQRVRAAYVNQTPDVLSFVVSATSFSEIVDSYEYLSRIGNQDRRIANTVRAAKESAAAERVETIRTRRLTEATVAVISARTAAAREVRDRLASDRDTLATAEQLKSGALTDLRETREEYLHEVEGLAAESAALAATIRSAGTGTGSGAPSASGFIWPVNGVVTSGFGMRWGRMHEGLDIAAPIGTPIAAAAGGTVIHAGWLGGYGNLVVVDHGNGLATAYGHASAILVSVGQHVGQGETVALVGSTGHSTGPHVHFEVRVNGVAVDPLLYL